MPSVPDPRMDTGKMLELRLKGLSYAEIGRVAGGMAKQSIEQRLSKFKRLLEHPEQVHAYREHEAEILDSVSMELTTSLIDDVRRKGKKALSGYQKVGMFGILFDKRRLLRGESTANVSNLTQIIQAALGDDKREPTTTSPSVSNVQEAELVPDNEAAPEASKRID